MLAIVEPVCQATPAAWILGSLLAGAFIGVGLCCLVILALKPWRFNG